MGFGDILKKGLDVANQGSKTLKDAQGMSDKISKFSDTMDKYQAGKKPTNLGMFPLALGGGDSKSITSGIPFLDTAIAEEEGGLFDQVESGISDLFGSEFDEAFESGVSALGGVANVMETAGGVLENFESLGQGLMAEGLGTFQSMAKDFRIEKADTKTDLVNMKDMFGLTGAELKAMTAGIEPKGLIDKIAGNIKQIDEVLQVPIDISKGFPAVSDYIDGAFTDLTENLPDVVGAVKDTIHTVTEPVSVFVEDLGGQFNTIMDTLPDPKKWGDIMGNETGSLDGYLKGSMSSIESLLTTTSVSLQTDLFGNLPEIPKKVDAMVPSIQQQILNGIPNLPTFDKAIDTLVGDTNLQQGLEDAISSLPATLNTVLDTFDLGMDYEASTKMIVDSVDKMKETIAKSGKILTEENISEIVTDILPVFEEAIAKSVPELPSITKEVDGFIESANTVSEVATTVSNIMNDLGNLPDVGDIFVGLDTEFQSSIEKSINNSLTALKDQVDYDVIVDSIVSDVLPNIPNLPNVDALVSDIEGVIGSASTTMMGVLDLDIGDLNISMDNVSDGLSTMTSDVFSTVSDMTGDITSTFDSLNVDFSDITNVTDQMVSSISDMVPNITDVINGGLPDIQAGLPDVAGYLNDAAGPLMDSFKSNLPAFPAGASEAIGSMVGFAQSLSLEKLGGLTDAAKGMLAGVDLPNLQLPDISGMEISSAIKKTFASIENIQMAQFGLDAMEKAKSMGPEITAALETFNNYSWEGSGFSLGAIGSYFDDIAETDKMKELVAQAMEGAPPLSQCTAKVAGLLGEADSAMGKMDGKIAEAEGAIDTIKELFA